MKNFYQVLSVPRSATQKEIAARFRELARDRHPDRFDGEEKMKAEAEFQDITEAFNVLRDPNRRAHHDMDLDKPQRSGPDPEQRSRVFMSRGIKAYKAGNYIQAADNFTRATEADPKSHQAYHHLALTCYQEDRWTEQAVAAIEKALQMRTGHAPYVKLAARIYLKAKMAPKAKEYYNELVRLGGSDAMVRKALEARVAGAKDPAASEQKPARTGLFGKKKS